MANAQKPREEVSTGENHTQTLARLWSVGIPRRLDPWAPQVADAFADGAWTLVWPRFAAFAPLAAFATGVLAPRFPGLMTHVFSESLIFMATVIAAGIWSGALGAMLVAGYIVGQTVGNDAYLHGQPLLRILGSLLISVVLLAMPAITFPQLAGRVLGWKPFNRMSSSVIRGLAYGAACGALILVWSQAMIVLIRPAFTWLGRSPTVPAIHQVQARWPFLVATAVVVGILRSRLEEIMTATSQWAGRIAVMKQERERLSRSGEFWEQLPSAMRVVLTTSLLTLLLAGMYAGWFDVFLVAGATGTVVAWSSGLLPRIGRRWTSLAAHVPDIGRVVGGALLSYLTARLLIQATWQGGSFRPVLLAALVTLSVFAILFPEREEGGSAPSAAPRAESSTSELSRRSSR